ncbi:MAG TPA: transglycosylase domain-containing protein [Egibacteraceae bacterium]|nr:transglycosylase domain-containing protein [Egibacteraceae bacterium]
MPTSLTRFLVGSVAAIAAAALLVAVSLGPTAGMAATVLQRTEGGLFDFPPLPQDLGSPDERSVVYARDGSVLAILHVENRKSVPLSQVPLHVQQAVLATEDADFYEHQGVNWRAILRAALGNLRAGEVTSGASTITQQVVKNAVTGGEVTLRRKVREAAYAVELEKRMDKRAILELYLNEAYFANGVYGIATAAEYYFGKDVGDLTVAEAALLAGMIRAPERNDPRDAPERARARRDIVLTQMAVEGFITRQEAERLRATPMELDIHPLEDIRNPFFVDYVRHLLKQSDALGPDVQARDRAVLRGGLAIHTTLDPRLQDIAQEVIAEALDRGEDPLAALTAVDPRSGEILALGFGPKPYGKGPGQTEVNPAVPGLGSSGRQAGSAFKAFQLVAALEEGISPGFSFQAGSRYTYKDPACDGHTVGNYADASQGVLDMASATAVSSNTYFARLVDLTGPDKLVEVAKRMGITSDIPAVCSLVLGSGEVFPLDMASAFGVLANEGVRCPPYAISRIVDRTGRVIMRAQPECERVVDKGIAARATSLLRGPIERGTASRNGRIGRPAAGKTGTSQDYWNAWFTGFVPQLSTAVWVGHERNVPMMGHPSCPRGMTGGCVPTQIWSRFMRRALDVLDLPVASFPAPPPIPTAAVPSVVGMTEEEATEVLEDAGFNVVPETVTDHRKAGTVVRQEPGGGGRAPKGGLISISVSDGEGTMPLVPSLLGMTEEEARAALGQLDGEVEVAVVREPAEEDRIGKVVAQSPEAGADATDLATITLTIGRARTADDPTPTPTGTPSETPSASATPTPTESTGPSPSPTVTEEPEPSPRPTRTRRPRPTESEQQ